MADKSTFLDYEGLAIYDRKIKEYIKGKTEDVQTDILQTLAEISTKVDSNSDAIDVLNGDEEKEGSVAKQIKDAISPLLSLSSQVETNTKDIEVLKEKAASEVDKKYVDEQDQKVLDSIGSIESDDINLLFEE